MKRIIICCSCVLILSGCALNPDKSRDLVRVNVRVLDGATNEVIPVMTCITNMADGAVHVPPLAETADSVSTVHAFYEGIAFDDDKNWIGPIRKMNGPGDNDDRSYVYENLPSLPYWMDPVAYQTSGDFTITLAPGTWRISLEHGNEYIPVSEVFTVERKRRGFTKTIIMRRWIDLPAMGWYSGDVHVHHPTNQPDFKDFLIEYAKAEDVHLVNLLEMGHHEGTEFKQEGFGEEFRVCRGDYCLVSGQEDPRSTYGHIIGLNIHQMVRDTSTYDYYDLVFKNLHKQPGAVVGFGHFSWNGCNLPRGFPWYITTEEIDFIELLQFSKINALEYYDYLNLGFRITAAAGSDVPWGSTIGEVRTFVYTGGPFSANAWFEGLLKGHTFVSNGPALFLEADGTLPGTEQTRNRGAVTRLNVKAFSHPAIGSMERVALYNNEGLLAEKLNPDLQDSLEISMDHTLDMSQWIAAVVYCNNGAVAHTTPIYFTIDGQPTWNPHKAPEIIEKQLKAIRAIEEETRAADPPDHGILVRLESAKSYYRNMLRDF